MNKARLGLGWIAALLLVAGYLASQYATAIGTFAEYASKVDQGPIVLLAMVLFAAAIVMFLFSSDSEEEA